MPPMIPNTRGPAANPNVAPAIMSNPLASESVQPGPINAAPFTRLSVKASSFLAAVMQRHRAGLQALRRDELEAPRALQALKQGRPVAREDRVDDETVLVDQPQPLERGRERGGT